MLNDPPNKNFLSVICAFMVVAAKNKMASDDRIFVFISD